MKQVYCQERCLLVLMSKITIMNIRGRLLYLSLLLATSVQIFWGNISSSSPYTGSTVTHAIVFNFVSFNYSADSYLQVGYSSNWALTNAITVYNSTSDFCENGCNIASATRNISGQNIQINGLLMNAKTGANFTIKISLMNIKAPSMAGDEVITLSIYNLGGGAPVATTTVGLKIYASLMTCSVTPTLKTVDTSTLYTFTITPNANLPLPKDGNLAITFPTRWSNSFAPPTFNYNNCLGATCSPSGNTITARNLFSDLTTSIPFTFTIDSVINPGSQQPNYDLGMKYYNFDGTLASQCQVTISGLIAASITGWNSSNVTVASSRYNLAFTTPVNIHSEDELSIIFPSEYSLAQVLKLVLTASGTNVLYPIVRPLSNTLSASPLKVNFNGSVSLSIQNLNVKHPVVADQITLIFKRNGYAIASGVCCSLPINATSNINASILLSNYKMQIVSDYRINFTISYYEADYFLIDFCSPFTLTPTSTYSCYFSLILNSTQLTCTAVTNSQLKVTLTNGSAELGGQLVGSSTVQLVVIGITNPSQSTCSVKVSSYNLPATQLEYSAAKNFNYTSVKMLNVKITAASTTVNARTSYTFSINNTNSLLPNSFLHIYFPSSFNLDSPVCSYNGTITTCTPTNSTYVKFALPPISISQYNLTIYALTVSNVINPPSLRPTSSFTLSLQSGGNNNIESVSEGVVVVMNTLTNFSSPPNLVCSSYVAGALAFYTFTFAHSIPLTASNVITLQISLPSAYTLAGCTACSAYSSFTLTNNTNSVVISSVYNPQTITVSSGIVLSLYVDGYLAIKDTIASPTFTVAPLTFTLTHNHTFLGEPLLLTLQLPFLPLSSTSLIITVPTAYDVSGLTLWSQGSAKVSYIRAGSVVTVTFLQLNTNNITLQMGGVISPAVVSSSNWILTVNDGSGVQMSNASGGAFSAFCGANCRECAVANTSYCYSCYNSTLVSTNPYLDNSTHVCVPACSLSQFARLAICYPCAAACLTCSISADNCTSCSSPFFHQVSVCVSGCSAGYYTSGRFCIACTNNCLTCNSTSCISCSTNYVLQTNSTCLLTCPAGQYNSSHTCRPCIANCSTCDWMGCTACIAGSYLVSWPTIACLSLCPQDYYFNATHCSPCSSPCSACSLSATNCTQCSNISANPYLYAYSCLPACPAATFSDQLKQCQSCPSNCLNCSSPTFCFVCVSPYLLYAASGQCLQSCFASTLNSSGQCQPCVSPCLTCNDSTTKCISCIETYFLLSNNTCTTNCGSLLAIEGLCTSCIPPCSTCNPLTPSICTGCMTGKLYYGGACWSSCPNHTYMSSASNCTSCTAPCASCSLSPTNCTACYYGSSLKEGLCHSPCPLSQFSYLGECSKCQPQCTSCPYQQPNQCQSCINDSYYWNPVTYECTLNCSNPYYVNANRTECLPCQLPCKTCLTNFNSCASCYSTLFLYNSQCISACPLDHYASAGVCLSCPTLCASCDSMKCLTCLSGNYFYLGGCYNSCPPAASNVYLGFCRNCLRSHCLLCNSQDQCIYCESGYLSYSADCVSSCPQNYEADTLTNTRCVLQPIVAYTRFISKLQNSKILLFPGTLFFILTLFLLPFAANRLFGFAVLLAVPQTVTVIQLAVHLWMQGAKLPANPLALPEWVGLVGVGLQLGLSWVWVRQLVAVGDERRDLAGWLGWGSNRGRWKLVMGMSLLNKQVSLLLFSGFFGLPFTSLKYQADRRLNVSNALFLCIFELPMLALSLLVAVAYRTIEFNSKLFFSSSDAAVIFAISICFQIALLKLADSQQAPPTYEKYVLPGVSNRSLPAYSDPNQQHVVDELDPNHLHRSNSQEDIFESSQMKAVDYMSELDPQDFFDETPRMKNELVPSGLEKGDFRKKNKKKRGHRRDGRLAGGLGIIEQEDEEELMGKGKEKGKKRKKKQEDVGGLHNFIYWKKPKEKKPNPGKIFHENEESIMSRIREKESQFDTITQNDIIFQDEPEMESSLEDYEIRNDSRRALQPNYDNYFNLNYAERQHLD